MTKSESIHQDAWRCLELLDKQYQNNSYKFQTYTKEEFWNTDIDGKLNEPVEYEYLSFIECASTKIDAEINYKEIEFSKFICGSCDELHYEPAHITYEISNPAKGESFSIIKYPLTNMDFEEIDELFSKWEEQAINQFQSNQLELV